MTYRLLALFSLFLMACPCLVQAAQQQQTEARARKDEAQAAARADQTIGELRLQVQELERENRKQIRRLLEQVPPPTEHATLQAPLTGAQTVENQLAATARKDSEDTDPFDSEEAQKKAEAALLRTGPTGPHIVPLIASSSALVGSSDDLAARENSIQGRGTKLRAEVVGLDRAISDLDAKITGTAIIVSLQSDVLFDFDKAAIRPAAEEALAKVALIIRKKGTGRVMIEGHTDAKGSEAYNQKLSERRAEAVKKWLIEHGAVAQTRLVTRGYGESRPVAANTLPDGTDNPEGRARNRRVEITISTMQETD